MSRFENTSHSMKLGEMLKTFTHSTHAMDTDIQTVMADALPIWELLGISEQQYHVKYPPVDLSTLTGNTGPTGPTGFSEPIDAAGSTGLTGATGTTE